MVKGGVGKAQLAQHRCAAGNDSEVNATTNPNNNAIILKSLSLLC